MSNAWQYYLDPEARRTAKREFLKFLKAEQNIPDNTSLWTPTEVLHEIEVTEHDLNYHDGWDCGCGG